MHIVFLLHGYYPQYSAVGKCLGNLVEVLEKEHKITVVTSASSLEDVAEEPLGNHRILRFTTKELRHRLHSQEKLRGKSRLSRLTGLIWLQVLRLFQVVKIHVSKYSLKQDTLRAYSTVLGDIKEPIDVIIPTCTPFETVVAALQYKKVHSNTKVLPVLFDKFSQSDTLHRTSFNKKRTMKKNQMLEKNMFMESDFVFHVPTWSPYIALCFQEYTMKTEEIEHPLIKEIHAFADAQLQQPSSGIHVVYTGVVDLKNRNPEPVLNLISLLEETNIYFHFFSLGSAQTLIEQAAAKKKNIICHGQVKDSLAKSALCEGQVLLSIGNRDISQVPSKIFEYMSAGKPIIHYAQFANDPAIAVLKDYPLTLILISGEQEQIQLEKAEQFIRENADQTLPFERIQSIYSHATPAGIARRLQAKFAASATRYSSYISLGSFCGPAISLESHGFRSASYPFDWLISDFAGVLRLMQNGFEDFLEQDFLAQHQAHREYYRNTKYNVDFYHDFDRYHSLESQLPLVREKYERRIRRFYEDIKKPTCFIRYIKNQQELSYIEAHFDEITTFIQSFHGDNALLFLANDHLVSERVALYHVAPDAGDMVARDFLENNKELLALLTSCTPCQGTVQQNLQRYQNKQRKKRLLRKYKGVLRRIKSKISTPYIHCNVIDVSYEGEGD